MPLGSNIRNVMSRKGLESKELAERLNISATYMSYLLNGKRKPSMNVLAKIADILEVDMSELVGNETEVNNGFKTKEEAIKFLLQHPPIKSSGFDVNKMSEEELINFSNELLQQIQLLSYKYKK